jgi:hypothetical protein
VLVQCESFFDAGRLDRRSGATCAGVYECRTRAAYVGPLEVPGWGANTMRTEFAVLTGIPETELGYDRFNPYYALARAPLPRRSGACARRAIVRSALHPFSARFFRRDLAMPPRLRHISRLRRRSEARRPPYSRDPDLARQVFARARRSRTAGAYTL